MKKQVNEMNEQEKEELLKQITQDLKETLSEKRYLHCISAMKKAKELVKKYGEGQEEQIVMLTTVAHDIAKEMSDEEFFQYAKENDVKLDEIDKIAPAVLHAKIGADIVKKKYGFTQEMQEAIYYHTTGRENMTMLDKIVFLADKSENRREGPDADKLRELIETEGLERAILWDIDYYSIPRTIEKQKAIHHYSINARNDILMKLKTENE